MEEKVSAISAARAARAAKRAAETGEGSKGASKKSMIQIILGIALLIGIVVIGYILYEQVSAKASLMWIFGMAFGITLQRSRFCFTAAVRDPILTGSSSLAKSVMIAIAIASVGFAAIHFTLITKGADPIVLGSGAFYFVKPVGLHTMVGAFLFGIGMIIAGGCASGTLMRIGEGFFMQLIALAFFILGVVLGIFNRGFWKDIAPFKSPKIYFPEVMGWFPALCLQFGLILICFLLIEKIAKRNKR